MSHPPGRVPAARSDPQTLRPLLSDPSAAARLRAVETLAALGTPEALALLGEALPEADRWLRLEIVRRLAEAGAAGPLEAVLADPDAQVRLEAIRRLTDETLLLKFLADPEPMLRRRALRALADQPIALAQALDDPDAGVRRLAAQGLAALPDVQAVGVARLLADPEPDLRELARRRLALLSDPDALPMLLRAVAALPEEAQDEALQPTEPLWREAPIEGLLGTTSLVRRLWETRPRELAAAVERLLGGDDPPAAVRILRAGGRPLAPLAAHPSARVRAAVLPFLDDPRLLVGDPEAAVARAAAGMLATRGAQEPALAGPYRRLVADPAAPEGARLAAVDRLLSMEGAAAHAFLAEAAPAAPRALLRRVASALARAGDAAALARLADVDDPPALRTAALALADAGDPRALIPLIRVAGEQRGSAAAARLGRFPSAREPAFLVAALGHRRVSVQRYAAEALADCPDPAIVEPLLAAAARPSAELQEAAVRALAKFAGREPRVTALLIGLLGRGEIGVRQAACEALGEMRIAEAVAPLGALLVHPFLRRGAEAALKHIGERRGLLLILRRRRRDEAVARARAGLQRRTSHGQTR
jgi:HEAT repeat protein